MFTSSNRHRPAIAISITRRSSCYSEQVGFFCSRHRSIVSNDSSCCSSCARPSPLRVVRSNSPAPNETTTNSSISNFTGKRTSRISRARLIGPFLFLSNRFLDRRHSTNGRIHSGITSCPTAIAHLHISIANQYSGSFIAKQFRRCCTSSK
jgi:hypothetical protein